MQARRVVLAILALAVLCAPRPVAGDLSAAVANGPRPGVVSNYGPDWQPRLPGARGDGVSLGPRALAFQIGARWADLEFSVATRGSAARNDDVASLSQLTANVETGAVVATRIKWLAGATVERLRRLQRTGASTPNELVAVAGRLDSAVTQLS